MSVKNRIVIQGAQVFLILLSALAAVAPMTHGAVWYVNATATIPAPDGKSWATAYPVLQTAVDAATPGDHLWVAKGTYTGTDVQVANLKESMRLYGGFAGTETAHDQRNWTANPTIIDGQQARRCVTAVASSAVDGFTIQNGAANDGAGMYNGTAVNCTFTRNVAVRYAGGMYNGKASNCTFTGNEAKTGGGGMGGGTVVNCTFTGNAAPIGGGMYYGIVTGCVFAENRAEKYAGGFYDGIATNCTFIRNTAAEVGGGMREGGATNCTFVGNFPGGISGARVSNCIVWGNIPGDVFAADPPTFSCLSKKTEGDGNIFGDPGFVNPWAGDFRLRADSPCVNAGTVVGAPAEDMLRRARPQGAGVDMGACEYYPGDDANAVLPAPVLRVSAASTATTPDGLTWETAFPTLREGAIAADYGTGTELWVARGTYTADDGMQVVCLGPETLMYGGFSGWETMRDERECDASATVIDGGSARQCISACPDSVADGFTLQNGKSGTGGGMSYGTAVNCAFTGNAASLYGGGMYYGKATSCTFTGNAAASGGGGMRYGTAANCTFTGNTAPYGGGMEDETATNCTFAGNSGTRFGGGIYSVIATNCTFIENSSPAGGGMGEGTAINCTFIRNTASYGGGMYYGTATNCTFTGNTASYGGGMYHRTATNCILWGNSPDEIGAGTASYSCVSVSTPGTGNIVGDPLFLNAASGDLRLRPGSPCIDTGTGGGPSTTDILGVVRPQGARVDMGAYEAVVPVVVPDLSGLARTTAQEVIAAAKLYAGKETEDYDASVPVEHVIRHSPAAGVQVPQWAPIELVISKGPPPPVLVPDLSGLSRAAARSTIAASRLQVGEETNEFHPTIPNDHLIRQTPAAGSLTAPWTPVDLVISKGPQLTPVPDLYGLAKATARDLIAASQLYVGEETAEYHPTMPNSHVLRQAPSAGTQVPLWTPINLTVSKGPQPVSVPGVVGQAQGVAAQAIANAGLTVGIVTPQYSATVPFGAVITQTPSAGTPALPGTPVDLVVSKGPQPVPVPDVLHQGQRAAAMAVTNVGLVVGSVTQQYHSTVPVGAVISQSPAPGAQVLPGTAVDLVISKGPQPVPVPGVVGQTQSTAAASITNAGLTIGTVMEQYSMTAPAGAVLSQAPVAGTAVQPGTAVDLIISRGAQLLVMPDVAGQSRAQAEAAITAAGLTVGTVTEVYSTLVAAGGVIAQDPAAGIELPPGTAVNIVVSLGPAPAEGEPGEGEAAGETVDTDTARQQLAEAYDAADTNGDGALSFEESAAALPGLTRAVFDELDTDGNGQLSADELGLDQGGCAGCRGGKAAFGPLDLGKGLSGLFLTGLGLMGLAAMGTLRRP